MKLRQGRRRKRGPRPLIRASELVGELLDTHGAKRELREHRVASHWGQIVGKRIADHTVPDGLSRGVLWVRVTTSAWLHELSFLKDELRIQINRELGDPPLVSEIRFHLGARRANRDAIAPTLSIRRAPLALRKLPSPASGERLQAIQREAGGVKDDELRAAIIAARRKLNL